MTKPLSGVAEKPKKFMDIEDVYRLSLLQDLAYTSEKHMDEFIRFRQHLAYKYKLKGKYAVNPTTYEIKEG